MLPSQTSNALTIQMCWMTLETAFKVYQLSVSVLGCGFNVVVVMLAVYRTPQVLQRYSVLIACLAASDLITLCSEMFSQIRLVNAHQTIAFAAYGPCQYFGPMACFVSHSVTMHLLVYSLYLLLVSFWYRHYVLFYGKPRMRTMIILLSVTYLSPFVQLVAYALSLDPPAEVLAILMTKYPAGYVDGSTISGTNSVFTFSIALTTFNMAVAVPFVYMAILYYRNRILAKLKTVNSHLSSTTKSLHTQLLKALTWQALMPGFFSVASIAFLVGLFDIFHHPALEFLIMGSVGTIPALTPLGSLLFVNHYRRRIQKSFCRRRAFNDGSAFPSEFVPSQSNNVKTIG